MLHCVDVPVLYARLW